MRHHSHRLSRRSVLGLAAAALVSGGFAATASAQSASIADIARYDGPDRLEKLAAAARKEGGLAVYTSFTVDDMKAVTEANMRRCLQIQKEIAVVKAEADKLGMRLLEANLITPTQLQIGLADHRGTGTRLGEALVARGFIGEAELERFIRQQALKRLPSPPPGRPQP